MVEQLTRNEQVVGSTPMGGSVTSRQSAVRSRQFKTPAKEGAQSRIRRLANQEGKSVGNEIKAGIAQLVEHQLPKLRAASSNLVSRSDEKVPTELGPFLIDLHRPRLA